MLNLSSKTEQGVKRSRESWFSKISRLFELSSVEEGTWEELEELLIAADVGVATTEELIQRTRKHARDQKLKEGSQVRAALKAEMVSLLKVNGNRNFLDSDSRQVIIVVGVNGSGKTTSIAKLAYALNKKGKRVILGAADTFRAAAIDQLKHWGQKIGIDVVAHQPGGDPGAVVYDTLQAAQNRQADVAIIDTAGRLHTKFNLMEELKKLKRVADKYDINRETLLVMDATTGQNGLAQARHFTETTGVSGIFLSKLDGTAKGGIVLAICQELKLPILFIGTGEQLDDMAPFDAEGFVEAIFS
ncbi:MAG: signal recognition particle-docking protein FtsY [Chloroflexi bacterium]|nr:signal recognition particle-docking protein FtsY [Chloroflexota bacterium]MBM3153956.1 signal recognition particle-docking protein FtsY [Chloroflexota bacterium]MBM3174776.1 signal recognition particle-docking protein FtsY [Chloroflexota bacterium]MBM4450105.1 signal recognition particle-docking protein FtsY [Chloroflexota bacterium]